MPKPLRSHQNFVPRTITITSTDQTASVDDKQFFRKWKGVDQNGDKVQCWIPDYIDSEVLEKPRRRHSAATNRILSEKAKAQWQRPLDDVKAAGIRIRGKRPTKAEARKASQKLARKKFIG